VSLLRTIQRGWIKGRNDCWKAHDVRGCVEGNMLWRDAELVADWSLIAPRSAEVYDCGDPAEEVRVTFFETEVPSVRLRRGDESVAAVLDLQAADMTYVAEDGSTFTLGADDPDHGALQWPGGPEEMCSRR
jgi:hypothetical protein